MTNTSIDFGLLAGAGAPVRAYKAGDTIFLFTAGRSGHGLPPTRARAASVTRPAPTARALQPKHVAKGGSKLGGAARRKEDMGSRLQEDEKKSRIFSNH
jgi:hypothetical protein